MTLAVRLDEHGVASLDGTWEFYPGDHAPAALDGLDPSDIEVPGLWEAQGWLELDGVAWYRRRFTLSDDDVHGFWTLHFGAVMDISEVFLNGVRLGGHDNPFTPFSVNPTGVLRAGENVLDVRVFDPTVDDPEHIRMTHGKQGWANWVFPSRPSLYMTYGGIWQSVTLCRHGQLTIGDVFVNSNPDDLCIEVVVVNHGDTDAVGELGVRAVGHVCDQPVAVPANSTAVAAARFGPSEARRWSPADPALHTAQVDLVVDGAVSDLRRVRFGLRTITVDGKRLLLNGEPYRMKSALVQGFRADTLYAEGDRAAIEKEVRAAAAMGFNTLRLHIKAFHPLYLDVCDELGMLVHCDIPVAEPIDHENLGDEGESVIATRSVQAVRQQVTRDRNHPSVLLWSVMNELCYDRLEARAWDRYERFARALVRACRALDPTRPIIENDWVEPDPGRVFEGDVLTAHWYGRLHADYLDKVEQSCRQSSDLDKPLYVSEFGDWGLPQMPSMPEPPFWDTRVIYATGLANTQWPTSIARFITETHRYQGLSDRLQIEVFRRHDHIGGYCVTELTDVPHELNGLLDLHRNPKPIAVAEVTRANQTVLPMLRLDSLVVVAGEFVKAPLFVSNDGPALEDVCVDVRFGDTGVPRGPEELLRVDASGLSPEQAAARFSESAAAVRVGRVEGYKADRVGSVQVAAPWVPGSHDLVLRLTVNGECIAENRYTLHVVAPPATPVRVQVLGDSHHLHEALGWVLASPGPNGPTVVAEGALDGPTGAEVRRRLAAGEVVVVLAQPDEAAAHYPVPVTLFAVATEWGSSVFHFTTDHGAIPSLPRRNVLVAEDSTVQARSVVTKIEDGLFPETPVVIAYKPVPGAMTGTIIGSHQVGPGRLVFCQYRLTERASKGDAAARAILADVVRWAARERRVVHTEDSTLADGRRVARYSHAMAVAR